MGRMQFRFLRKQHKDSQTEHNVCVECFIGFDFIYADYWHEVHSTFKFVKDVLRFDVCGNEGLAKKLTVRFTKTILPSTATAATLSPPDCDQSPSHIYLCMLILQILCIYFYLIRFIVLF